MNLKWNDCEDTCGQPKPRSPKDYGPAANWVAPLPLIAPAPRFSIEEKDNYQIVHSEFTWFYITCTPLTSVRNLCKGVRLIREMRQCATVKTEGRVKVQKGEPAHKTQWATYRRDVRVCYTYGYRSKILKFLTWNYLLCNCSSAHQMTSLQDSNWFPTALEVVCLHIYSNTNNTYTVYSS